jgi:hypothetical protein
LETLLSHYPDNAAAQKELCRTKSRIEEKQSASFNFHQMLDAVGCNTTNLDCATFIGPVAVKESKGRGRGVFLTKDVKAGDLLVCEKACAVAHKTDTKPTKTSIVINVNTNRITMGQQASVITKVVNLLYRNPSKMPVITSLHSGSYKTVQGVDIDENEPVVDT